MIDASAATCGEENGARQVDDLLRTNVSTRCSDGIKNSSLPGFCVGICIDSQRENRFMLSDGTFHAKKASVCECAEGMRGGGGERSCANGL